MSLILEALRKLERDKETPEQGFVVMAHVPWARSQPRSRLVGIGVVALALAVGALAMALFRGRATSTAVPPGRPPEATATGPARPPGTGTPSPKLALPSLALAPPSLPPAAAPASRSGPEARPRATPTLGTPAQNLAPPAAPPLATTPPPARPSSGPEIRLNAISRQDDGPVAILNDRLVHEGDEFDGIRVIRIGTMEVEVEVRGQRRVLTF